MKLLLSVILASAALADAAPQPLKVALYLQLDNAYYQTGQKHLRAFLTQKAGFSCEKITAEEIRAGGLEKFDVLIVPGGAGSKQAAMLEEDGRSRIRDFVVKGGGYVGICAGSYLASADYPWSLNLINAKVVDKKHWARGKGDVTITFSNIGKQLLASDKESAIANYRQGPLFAPAGRPELPAFESLAIFTTAIAKNGATPEAMIGTTAIASAPFGEGRVICYGPHPERPGGPNNLIIQGVRWAAGRENPVSRR